MASIKVGNIEIDVWTGGHPIWSVVMIDGVQVAQINSLQLRDLQYAVKQARRAARQEARRFDPDRIADY